MKFSKASLALIVVQLVLVSSIAGKYLYQRWTCPRVWVGTVALDPDLTMRGRYLSLTLQVNGCGRITAPPPLKSDQNPNRNMRWFLDQKATRTAAQLTVEGNNLVAIPLHEEAAVHGNTVVAQPGASCNALRLEQPVDFYIAEHATDPTPLHGSADELWVEVTVPPKGPPRPLQLALKRSGVWKPLAFK